MKTLLAVVIAFVVGYLLPHESASAYPGMMCVGPNNCGHCEVCVKAKQTDPTGTCMVVAGCY